MVQPEQEVRLPELASGRACAEGADKHWLWLHHWREDRTNVLSTPLSMQEVEQVMADPWLVEDMVPKETPVGTLLRAAVASECMREWHDGDCVWGDPKTPRLERRASFVWVRNLGRKVLASEPGDLGASWVGSAPREDNPEIATDIIVIEGAVTGDEWLRSRRLLTKRRPYVVTAPSLIAGVYNVLHPRPYSRKPPFDGGAHSIVEQLVCMRSNGREDLLTVKLHVPPASQKVAKGV